jgi:hypothetical protein
MHVASDRSCVEIMCREQGLFLPDALQIQIAKSFSTCAAVSVQDQKN